MLLQQPRCTAVLAFGISILAIGVHTRADVAPPIEIKMSPDTRPAVSGQEYAGVLELHLGTDGMLTELSLAGDGWTVLRFDAPALPLRAQSGILRIPFRALPRDADEPIIVSLRFNGFKLSKPIDKGPAYFARRGQVFRAVPVPESELPRPVREPAGDVAGEGRGTQGKDADGRTTLRFDGRIVYQRSDGQWVGADRLDVRVWDSDTIGHETMWEGYTDTTGYFDTDWFPWDDPDDDPDLVVYFETETDWVDVTDSSIAELTYTWETEEIENFQGNHHNFGNLTVASDLMPALHLHSTVTRARRWVYTRSNGYYSLPQVQVEWPDNSSSSPSWYQCWGGDESEIHTTSAYEWHENVLCHEYGHHFHCSTWDDWQESDYCNDGDWCDPVPGDDCTHCAWCQENLVVAWKEGIAQHFAHRIPPTFAEDYVYDVEGAPHVPLHTSDFETPQTCQEDPLHFHDARLTEGFVGALLVDMADYEQDDHDTDGIRDSACFGDESILSVIAEQDPANVLEFIDAWTGSYPELADALWPTAFNVSPWFAGPPGDDTGVPTMLSLDSPSHPLGSFGVLPCTTVQWRPQFDVEDDVTGACEYSYVWTTDPEGAATDTLPDLVDFSSCDLRIHGGPFYLGEYYLSIRVQDCAGHWGPRATFGPFVVGECNNNGILDICEIACDQSGAGLECTIGTSFCDVPGCETAQDCNGNLVPDDCDVASGASADCNLNAIPDECENMYHWDAASGSWHVPSNWLEGATPTTDSEVCIDVPGDLTVSYSLGTLQIATLASSESLALEGTTGSRALTITEPSFVMGNLRVKNNDTVLQVDDRLDISGLFEWTGSSVSNSAKLKGPGVTYANGGVQISDIVQLEGHRLVLDGNSTSVITTGRVNFTGPAVFEIRPGSTYEHRGSGGILNGWFSDRFVNGGTLIKSVDPGSSTIYMFTENNGLIHVQAGTLQFYLYGNSTGDFLGDPSTTLHFVDGGFAFYAGSSVVAHTVIFGGGGGGWNSIYGTWDVAGPTTVAGGQVTFANTADIVSYGSSFFVTGGTVNFNAPIGGPIQFDTLSVGPGGSGGTATANFNSGDPVHVTNLILGPGTIAGPSDITIDGLLTWNGGGYFNGPGTINADGDVLVNAATNQRMLANCVLNNAGTATLLGGFNRTGSAVLNNLETGVIDIRADGGIIYGYGLPLNNAGTMVKSAGTGTSTIQAAMNNTGTIEVQTGVLSFYTGYGGSYVQTAGQTVLNGGDLHMSGPASLQINGGLLTGMGTITGNVVNSAGTVTPGLSAGQINIVGTYAQPAGGTLEIEIAGLLQGSEYDLLTVSGAASLAGNLDVVISTNGGFAPAPGDSFQILAAGSVAGQFNTVGVTGLSPYLDMQVAYTAQAVTLHMVGVVPADCDLDGDADLNDFADLETCLGGLGIGIQPGCRCFDFDDDGDIDLRDFAEFQAAFAGS